MKKNTSRTKNDYRKAIRALFRFREGKKLPAQRGEDRSGIHHQLRLVERGNFAVTGSWHGGGSKEMVRDHACQGEVEGNPRRYRRWPLRASNLPGPLSRCSFSSFSRIFSKLYFLCLPIR